MCLEITTYPPTFNIDMNRGQAMKRWKNRVATAMVVLVILIVFMTG